VDALLEQGQDLRQFLSGVVEHVRNLLVIKIAGDPGRIIELPAADIEAIKQQAASAETEQLLMIFDSLSKTLDEMRWSPHQRFTFEVGLIKACSLAPLKPLGEVLGKMQELEAKLASGGTFSAVPPAKPAHKISEQHAPYSPSPVAKNTVPAAVEAPTPSGGVPGDIWPRMLSALKTSKPGLATALEHSRILRVSDSELLIGFQGNSFQQGRVEEPESRNLLEKAAGELLGRTVRVNIQAVAAQTAPKPPARAASVKQSKSDAQNPAIQEVFRAFPGAEVVETSSE
jgi:DNA polymerase-3 subunit gamma/tau